MLPRTLFAALSLALQAPIWFICMGIQLRLADIHAEWARVEAECRDQPKVVPYHDGMTLCPGQSTIMVIPIEIVRRPGRDI